MTMPAEVYVELDKWERAYKKYCSQMTWSVYGQMTRGDYKASVELINENGHPQWFCYFSKNHSDTFLREFFEIGKLEEAYEWCIEQFEAIESRSD